MEDYRAELQQVNARCAALGIEHTLLTVADVMAIVGWSRKTVKRRFRFGGQRGRPFLSRSQLARQVYDLAQYRAE